MSGIPTMASEAPADGPSLSAAEAWAIEHEAPLHSCPGCGAKTTGNDVCSKCSAVPCGLVGCINCDAETTEGVCDICDPAPLLAEITSAHVSPEVVRLAVEAAVAAEREEIAEILTRLGREAEGSFEASEHAAGFHAGRSAAYLRAAQVVLARGRVSIG